MKKHIKLVVFLSAFLIFFLIQGVRADVPTFSGDFYRTHNAEYLAYGTLGTVAVVCVVAAIALVILGGVRRSVLSKKNPIKKNDQK